MKPRPDGPDVELCEACHGEGETERDRYVRGPNADGLMAVRSECFDCEGTGWIREPNEHLQERNLQ